MILMYWNVKYFGENSPNKDERIANIRQIVGNSRNKSPDIIVLVELTRTANAVVDEIVEEIDKYLRVRYDAKLGNAGGGNNEHFAVLIKDDYPTNDMAMSIIPAAPGQRIGGGTRGVGKIRIPSTSAHGVPGLTIFICHPSPCGVTNKTALADARNFVQTDRAPPVGPGPSPTSIMVGDFNTTDWPKDKNIVAPENATHRGRRSLKTLDGAVISHDLIGRVELVRTQRVNTAISKSDHSYMIYEIN